MDDNIVLSISLFFVVFLRTGATGTEFFPLFVEVCRGGGGGGRLVVVNLGASLKVGCPSV